MNDEYFNECDECDLEFLCKFKDKSYIHCKWIESDDLILPLNNNIFNSIEHGNVIRAIKRWRNDDRPSTYYDYNYDIISSGLAHEENDNDNDNESSVDNDNKNENKIKKKKKNKSFGKYIDPRYLLIERIIDRKINIKRDPNDVKKFDERAKVLIETFYLCKWVGLSYQFCTWEIISDLFENNKLNAKLAINKYEKLIQILPKSQQEWNQQQQAKPKNEKFCTVYFGIKSVFVWFFLFWNSCS